RSGRVHVHVLLLPGVRAAASVAGTARQYRENTQRVHGRSLQLGSFVWRRPHRCMRKATVELTRRGQSSAYGGAPHLGSAPQSARRAMIVQVEGGATPLTLHITPDTLH